MVSDVKRKVFISYYHGDQKEVEKFIKDFSEVFIPKVIGVKEGDFVFDSNNPQYIMRRIREDKLQDSTVTIVLIGNCTHSRRYVDWEIKASLQQGQTRPNGLIGINLPYMERTYAAPQRLMDNLKKNSYGVNQGYARYYTYPSSKSELQKWIEDAHKARINRASLIYNGRPMMKYNSKCRFHDITH